ncbi:MAG: hypothetical protein IPK12_07145 [Gemmatimonadetes bacterium]|nr:hypothetical protein [Gemmatimonadota bacterium]
MAVNLVLDNALLGIGAGGITQFDNVSFINTPAIATALTVTNPGSQVPYTFTNVSFGTTPTAGGFYLAAIDSDGAIPDALTIQMATPTPGTPGPFVSTANGAVVTWPAVPITWTGAADTDYNNPANWSTGAVPTASDDVLIPATANNPVSGGISVRDLTVQAGATLFASDHTYDVGGDLDVQGLIGGPGGCCNVQMTGTGVTARGNLEGFNLDIATGAVVTLNGPLNVSGGSGVNIAGELILGGNVLNVGQSFVNTTGNTGVLTMTDPAGQVQAGITTFSGGDETGHLTAGFLFTQSLFQGGGTVPTSFAATNTHRVILGGPSSSQVAFTDPGPSHFQDLEVSGVSASLQLQSDIQVDGFLISAPGGVNGPVINSNVGFRSITAGSATLDGNPGFTAVTFDNVRLVITGLAAPVINDVVFTNMDPNVNQLTLFLDGRPTPYVLDNLDFQSVPAGGRYLNVDDPNGPSPDPLVVQVTNTLPAAPAGFINATGGASIIWNGILPGVSTWTGAADNNFDNAANWDTGVVPDGNTNVVIPATANNPVSGGITVKDLTIQAGASLEAGDHTYTINGNLDAQGVLGSGSACCDVTLTGSNPTVRGNIQGFRLNVPNGTVATLNGTLSMVNAPLEIAGELIVAGHTLLVDQNLLATINGTGLLTMTNPADQVTATQANFGGGDETGRLTAGVLTLGAFQQQGPVATSFFASGNHRTAFGYPGSTGIVSFANPGTSRFQDMDLTGVGGLVQLNSDVTAAGQLISATGSSQGGTLGNTGGFVTLTAGAPNITANVGVTALVVDGVRLVFGGGSFQAFSHVLLQNMDPNATQLTFNNVGGAAPYVFDEVAFATAPSAGLYVALTDLDGPSPNTLQVDFTNAAPASPGSFTSVANGAILTWNGSSPSIATWTGTGSSNWSTAGNWSTGSIPTVATNVVIPSGTPFSPVLTAPAVVNNISLGSGATLDLATFGLAVGGDLDNGGLITATPGAGGLSLAGPGNQLRGDLSEVTVAVAGNYTLSGRLLVGGASTGDLAVTNGSLTFNGFTLETTGLFATSGSGTIVMQQAQDSLIAGGGAVFQGGDLTGLVTTGAIVSGGDFLQGGTAAAPAFVASGSNVVRLTGSASSLTTVGSNSTTIFANLDIATSGPVTIQNAGDNLNVDGTGQFRVLTPVLVDVQLPAASLKFDGGTSTILSSSLTGTNVTLVVGSTIQGGYSVTTTTWNQGTAPQMQVPATLPYQNLTVQGTSIFLPPGAFNVPGTLMGMLPNANSLHVRDTLGTPTDLTVGQDLQMFAGILAVDGGKVTIGRDLLLTTNNTNRGRLGMQLAADTVTVGRDALFDGANQTGLLTAGVLQVAGNFTQAATSVPTSFVASGTHLTELNASGAACGSSPARLAAVRAVPGGGRRRRGAAAGPAGRGGGRPAGGLPSRGGGRARRRSGAPAAPAGVARGRARGPAGPPRRAWAAGSPPAAARWAACRGAGPPVPRRGRPRLVPRGARGLPRGPRGRGSAAGPPGGRGPPSGGAAGRSPSPPGSTFRLLANVRADHLGGTVPVGADLIATTAAIVAQGRPLQVANLGVTGLTLDNASVVVNEQGTIRSQVFNNVTYQNLPTAGALPLSLTLVGVSVAARNVTFTGVNYPVLPIGAGNLYAQLTSSNGFGVNLIMSGSNRITEGPATQQPAQRHPGERRPDSLAVTAAGAARSAGQGSKPGSLPRLVFATLHPSPTRPDDEPPPPRPAPRRRVRLGQHPLQRHPAAAARPAGKPDTAARRQRRHRLPEPPHRPGGREPARAGALLAAGRCLYRRLPSGPGEVWAPGWGVPAGGLRQLAPARRRPPLTAPIEEADNSRPSTAFEGGFCRSKCAFSRSVPRGGHLYIALVCCRVPNRRACDASCCPSGHPRAFVPNACHTPASAHPSAIPVSARMEWGGAILVGVAGSVFAGLPGSSAG